VTFTTLGYGDYRPTTPLGQVLAGTESLVGGVLLALLVAVLGRRLMR
jgi:voltage-gated potassium channel Kch